MKKVFLAAIMATTLISSSFASETKKVNGRASYNFQSQFSEARDVDWTVRENFVKASFVEEGVKKEAFYDNQGELLSTSTSIDINQLPSLTKRAFAKKYAGYVVKDAVMIVTNDETAYYISVENNEQSLILKVLDGTITTFKRTVN